MFMFALLLDRVTKSISSTSAHTHRSVSWLTGSTYETIKVWCQKCDCRQLYRPNWASSMQCSTRRASHLNSRPKAPRGFWNYARSKINCRMFQFENSQLYKFAANDVLHNYFSLLSGTQSCTLALGHVIRYS